MTKMAWCKQFVVLDGRPISFAGRGYLHGLYASNARRIVLRCSRQTEKSTFLALMILYAACTQAGIKILYVCPRLEQGRSFVRAKLHPLIRQSPLIRTALLGRRSVKLGVENLIFHNGSQLYIRAAFHSADACRGLSVDLLLLDEFQDIAAGVLPVLAETQSHAAHPQTILTGTPKSLENHLEDYFRRTSSNEWTMECPGCGRAVIPDERALGFSGLACPGCQHALDVRTGRWVPRNQGSTWGDGFWIGHPLVPWLNYAEILDRQRTYDLPRFKNECLGLPTALGDHVVTREELAACCRDVAQAHSLAQISPRGRGSLVAGIDWGGGSVSRTVLVIGYMDDQYKFRVARFERFAATADPSYIVTEIANRCRAFQVRWIAADGGGNGTVLNRLLLDKLERRDRCLYAILYSTTEQAPRPDGLLTQWTVGRSASIGTLFTRIKTQKLQFPRESDCGSYVDEFAAVFAEYDDLNRTVKYSHPESRPDDAVHATNYALLVATREYLRRH